VLGPETHWLADRQMSQLLLPPQQLSAAAVAADAALAA
jgi:hypothetical protein